MIQNANIQRILLIGGAGYVGTAVYDAFIQKGFLVDICDKGTRGFSHVPVLYPFDSEELTSEQLNNYNIILWFAGFSNVKDSLQDPTGAIEANVSKLARLSLLTSPHIQIIYASTGSLYSSLKNNLENGSVESDEIYPGKNAYDVSKFCFDYIAQSLLPNFVGLRMGTVSGFSRNIRPELIFNAMCLSALKERKIYVSNPEVLRSIVFIDHLIQFLMRLVVDPIKGKTILNIASLSGSIGSIATQIGEELDAEIVMRPPSPTYSFCLNIEKMNTLLPIEPLTISNEVQKFKIKIFQEGFLS